MAVFFLLVWLEIKREALAGELASPRQAALPIAAAIGGMVVPASIYVLTNGGGMESRGWAIPMATDIAFALGVLALVAPRAPSGLKIFLAALAIVDDMGAVLVIALFYTGAIPTRTRINAADFSAKARGLLDYFDRTETRDLLVLTSKGQQEASRPRMSQRRAHGTTASPGTRASRALGLCGDAALCILIACVGQRLCVR